MTMDELNALYNNMSVYGDTYNTAPSFDGEFQKKILPVDTPYIDEPLIPALPMQYINQGSNGNNGITSIAPATYEQTYDPNLNFAEFTSGVKGTPSFTQEYTKRPGVGIQSLFEFLQRISPMANIMKLGNNVLTNTQKYFADKKETEKLEALAQIEQAKKQKEAQAIIDATLKKQMQDTGVTGDNYNQAANIAGGGGGNQVINTPAGPMTARQATYDNDKNTGTSQSYSQHYARGGRTGYGKGGIVSL